MVEYALSLNDAPVFENYLASAYPNPFKPTTTIRYGIEHPTHVSILLHDTAGRPVRHLVDEPKTLRPGGHSVVWDGTNDAGENVASGVHLCRIRAGNFTQSRKLVLFK